MNKSKLKNFIGSIFMLNFLVTAEKVYAAMRRSPSPPRTSQQTFKTFWTSSDIKRTGKSTKELRASLRQSQHLTLDEAHPIIESVKSSLNSGDYKISPRLQSTLNFMGQSEEGLKSAINLLDKTHYKKSHDDYREQKGGIIYKQTVYSFEKNNSGDDRKIYLKFGLNKENKNLNIITYSDSSLIYEGIDPTQDVSKILNNPSFFNVDLLGRAADKAILIAKEKISQGKYVLAGRTRYGIQQMGYSYEEFREIMSSLTKKSYILGPEPIESNKNNPHHLQNGNVFVFGPREPKKNKDLYIKFVIDNEKDDIFVLSFHERTDSLEPFFKELQ